MRKIGLLFGVLALAVLCVGTANAVTLLPGDFQAHFTDASCLYEPIDDGQGNITWRPRAPLDIDPVAGGGPVGPDANGNTWSDTAAVVGDENRTIFNVNQFLQLDVPYYAVPPGELTGMMYDLELTHINQTSASVFDLYFMPLGRNPVPLDGDAPAGAGGVIEVWFDPTPDGAGAGAFDPNGVGDAPFLWSEAAGPDDGTGRLADLYPTMNGDDVSLWLQMVLNPSGEFLDVDGIDQPGDPFGIYDDFVPFVLKEHIDLGTRSGSFESTYLNIISGSAAEFFDRDVYGPGNDMQLAATFNLPPVAGTTNPFTNSPQDQGNWAVQSSDPIRGNVIPEPASLTLIGLGLAGLIARGRRRKK